MANAHAPARNTASSKAIDIARDASSVSVDLKAKAGETIDEADIARCLDHTAGLLKP